MNKIKNTRLVSTERRNNSANSIHSVSKIRRLVSLLLNWFSANARDLPWRRTRDPYAIWVSEIMLQQTQVKTVIPYWKRWLRELPSIEAVAKAGPDKIHKLWEGLGYYTRARNLQKAAQQIVTHRGGGLHESQIKKRIRDSQSSSLPKNGKCEFPKNFDAVLALPGIGRYTAGAICSIAFNQPTPILDGNVIRVLARVFGITGNPKEKETNKQLWNLAEDLVWNSKFKIKNSRLCCSHLNQSLMELGALICTPRNPQCEICPIKKLCIAFRTNRINELPNFGQREATTARRFFAFVVERNGRFLVRQRPAGIVNAHLWEFPNVEILNGDFDPNLEAKKLLGITPLSIELLCTIKHSITRYRITLEAFRIIRPSNIMHRPEIGTWKTPAELRPLTFTAAHGKILNSVLHHGPASNSAGR
jgi:A/G-specific adenine glycosylase